jgi:hypothetical protein
MDKCRDASGNWIPEVSPILAAFPGANEISNSCNGLHVWARYRGVAPPHAKKSKAGLDRKWLELYTELRFIALGGLGIANGAMVDITDILPGFIDKYFPPAPGETDGDWSTAPVEGYTHLDDDELLRRALAGTRKQSAESAFGGAVLASFADLWTRNIPVLSRAYPPAMEGKELNASDADCALAKELAYWTGKDCERIKRLMLMSAMKRDKWDWHRDYLEDTVLRGVAFCQAVYHVKAIAPPSPPPGKLAPRAIEHNTFVGRESMAELFTGCVYIQDSNAILIPNGDIVDQARFKARYAGYTFAMDNENTKTSRDAWDAFINNSVIEFPRVEGTCFDPKLEFQSVVEKGGRRWVNVYKQPTIIRAAGDVQPFMGLLKKILPNGDDSLIILCYMAACCQYPGRKFRWAPFLQGTPGNGKSTIVECLKHALGNKYIFSVKTGMIENNFNAWLENNVLYVADDIYSSKDRTDMMEALKSLITQSDQGITYKGIDSIQKSICGNFFFTDNHRDAMRKASNDRRLAVFYSAQQTYDDRERDGLTEDFFTRPGGFVEWLEGGGYAAVADMLHTMPIDPRYNPAGRCQEAPKTSATREAIDDGRTNLEHDVIEWIEQDEPGFCGGFVSATMLKRKLEGIQRYQRSLSPLKIKELMGRLGYDAHPGLVGGRCVTDVNPDQARPVLFVRRGSDVSLIQGAAEIGRAYEAAQALGMSLKVQRRMSHV